MSDAQSLLRIRDFTFVGAGGKNTTFTGCANAFVGATKPVVVSGSGAVAPKSGDAWCATASAYNPAAAIVAQRSNWAYCTCAGGVVG